MTTPHVVIASPYNADRLAYNGIIYSFCKVLTEVTEATLVAPPARADKGLGPDMMTPLDKARDEVRRALSLARHRLGLPRLPLIAPARLPRPPDVFVFACTFLHDLPNLDRIEGWERSPVKIAFVLESWSALVDAHARTLRQLDRFDHVFVLNRSSLAALRRHVRAPCSFLPVAADHLVACPGADGPERSIDVYSMGRRSPALHDQLLRAMADGRIFYQFDPITGGRIACWAESRALTAQLIKRSRYFIAFDPSIGSARKSLEASGESALSARYFEGAAGGAVMLGSAPSCGEFGECFDWPDALIDIPSAPDDIMRVLQELDAQPQRLTQIRRRNMTESLARHDWSHRWETIARAAGLPLGPAFHWRKAKLEEMCRAMLEQAPPREARAPALEILPGVGTPPELVRSRAAG